MGQLYLATLASDVATSTQRQYPIALTETDTSQTITANTTNLINININNGGNLTAIATGENHVLGNELTSNMPTEHAQIDTSSINVTNNSIANHESCMSFPTNTYYTIPVSASEVCTNQNCDLNLGNTCSFSLSSSSNVKEVQTCTNQNILSVSSATMPKDRTSERLTESCDNSSNRTILPPPIFDSITNESNTASEDLVSATKLRATGKRYHRTIPRQFAAVDPIINPLKNNRNNIVTVTASSIPCSSESSKSERLDTTYNGAKRLSCQCPVQHMPIYLSSHTIGLNHNSNETVSASMHGNARVLTMKKRISSEVARHVNMPTHTASTQIKSVQVASAHCKGTLRKSQENYEGCDRSIYSNSNYAKMQHVSTTDKAIHEQAHVDNQIVLKKQNSLSRRLAFSGDCTMNLNPILKSSAGKSEQDLSTLGMDADIHISTIVQPCASTNREMHRKTINSSKSSICIEQNPELPPKMYKHNTGRISGANQKSYYSNSKTHAISKPSNDNAKFSIPTTNTPGFFKHGNKLQKNNYSKSLPRNVISASHEYAQVSKNTIQSYSSSDSSTTNINFNTLPKKTSKLSTRSSNLLTEVVNKVPSVINIPSPLQPSSFLAVGPCVPSSIGTASAQLTSIISSNKRSQHFTSKKPTSSMSSQDRTHKSMGLSMSEHSMKIEKPLPVLTTSTNCANPKEHFLPNDNSLDDDYLSECENCKSAHGSRYYLEEEIDDVPQETMTLQRKMPENEEDQQNYYRVSSTLPTNTSRKTPTIKNRETWFTTIPASSSSDEEEVAE